MVARRRIPNFFASISLQELSFYVPLYSLPPSNNLTHTDTLYKKAIDSFRPALGDRWQPLLFGCFLVIGCQKFKIGYLTVTKLLSDDFETVE